MQIITGNTESHKEMAKSFGENPNMYDHLFPLVVVRPYPNKGLVGLPIPTESPYGTDEFKAIHEDWLIIEEI